MKALFEFKTFGEIGSRFFQHVMDLTNEWDVEMAIKDCDVVINTIGEKKFNLYDNHFEEPNILIPRTIAKVCARKKYNNVKRLRLFT